MPRLVLIYRIAVLSLEMRSRNCWFSRISLSGFFFVSFYASLRGAKPLTVAELRQAGDRRAVFLLRAPQLVEFLQVEPKLARSPEAAPDAARCRR